jgi:hypothetical protein
MKFLGFKILVIKNESNVEEILKINIHIDIMKNNFLYIQSILSKK